MTSFLAATQGLGYLDQIVQQHDLCTACLKIVSRQDDYVENIKVLMHQKNSFDPKRIKGITPAFIRAIVEGAKKSEREEFPLLCRNTLVALCGGLESLIKDYVAASFIEDPERLRRIDDKLIRLPISSVVHSTSEERARIVVDELYRNEGAKRGHSHRFLTLLEYVHLDLDRKKVIEHAEDLDEAYEVRNAIVHRGGIVDQRLASKVPGLTSEIGSSFEMNGERFQKYRRAILEFSGQTLLLELL